MYGGSIQLIHFDILNSVLNSARHDASNSKVFFIIFKKLIYGGYIKIIKFDILKSGLNSARHDASNGKEFFIKL